MENRWKRELLYFSGDQYFKALIGAIDRAQHSIAFEVYIFEKSIVGDQVIESLVRASQRGVQVRLIIDGLGSPQFASAYLSLLRSAKIKVRFYRAVPWIWQRLPGEATNWLTRVRDRFRNVNKGNHRKFCLIDNSKLLIGSFNVSDVHSESISKSNAWRDLAAEVEGHDVAVARKAFLRAFRTIKFPRFARNRSHLLLTNESLLSGRFKRTPKLQRIRSTQQRIWIETPYFVPTGRIIRSLIAAVKRNVEVVIIVPQSSDVWMVQWMSLSIIHHLSSRGVKIYIYSPQFNHRKVFIIDDWMCLGSSNLNHRSLLHDLEMDVVVTHRENKDQLEKSFVETRELSELYQTKDWFRLPTASRWIGSFLLYLRYWA